MGCGFGFRNMPVDLRKKTGFWCNAPKALRKWTQPLGLINSVRSALWKPSENKATMSCLFFDTSALVPVVTEQLPNHASAHARFVSERNRGHQLCCSTHTLAECYATLTALPLPRRISGPEAARLIEVNFIRKLHVIDLTSEDYRQAMNLCADLGRISGQIYDALHLVAALKMNCTQIFSYNQAHFIPLAAGRIPISIP